MQSVLDRNNFIMIDSIVSSTFSSSKSISLFRARKMFQWSAIILLSLLSSQATYAFWGDSNSIDSFHNDPNSMKQHQQQQQQQQKQSSVHHHKNEEMEFAEGFTNSSLVFSRSTLYEGDVFFSVATKSRMII
ncbi:hypothetical protein NH340_JMT07270 [Sarcoptes scabiei]|nr:hypothetical protein NH340_JMT07270 [Sarcoptes scabiei]